MTATLTLIRGLPGSGKSTLARKLKESYGKFVCYHFEADDYFMKNGTYQFDATKLSAAHKLCYDETDNMLYYNASVIVANTFTTLKEMRPYIELAKKYNVPVNVITCHGNFGSIHNVPDETIQKMKDRFAWDISTLIAEFA